MALNSPAPFACQKSAASVWSAVRRVLVSEPTRLDLLEVPRIRHARQGLRTLRTQSGRARDEERPHVAHPWRGLEHEQWRRPSPLARSEALDDRERREAPVVRPSGEHRRGGRLAHLDPAGLRRAIGDQRERRRQLPVEGRLLRREQRHEHAIRRGRDRRRRGVSRIGHRGRSQVRLIAALDRVHRVVDGALDHREMQVRDGRPLPGRGDDGRLGVGVPSDHGVGRRRFDRTRSLCQRDGDRPDHRGEADDRGDTTPCVVALPCHVVLLPSGSVEECSPPHFQSACRSLATCPNGRRGEA